MRLSSFVRAVQGCALATALACTGSEVAERSSGPPFVAPVLPAQSPEAARADAGSGLAADVPAISFLAVGDTGYCGASLSAVAAAMNRSARERPVALVLLLGDNFYLHGIDSLEDERWRSCFEDAFTGSALQVPFYAVLGNHDHRGQPDVQVAYTRASERWRMPARWYTFTETAPDGTTAQFFALDTEPIEEERESNEFQAEWLRKELERSTARWKIVFGHHPMISHGRHGGTRPLVAALGPMFDEHGVDLYVSGHDHDLQVLKSDDRWLQIVSGAGSSARRVGRDEDTLFAASGLGYARVGLGARTLWIEMATLDDGVVFRWEMTKD